MCCFVGESCLRKLILTRVFRLFCRTVSPMEGHHSKVVIVIVIVK